MHDDAFSRCHPAVNFVFFLGAIGFGVVIQHPAYIAAGAVAGAAYYLLLKGRAGWKMILGMLPVFALLSGLNPLINTRGRTVLFEVFGRNYTLEALCYGMAIAGVFVVMMLWFGCYSAVLTSDKFVCLFGSLIPALSLLLVMVLRLIPGFARKAKQISDARNSIGHGVTGGSAKAKLADGMTILSALTDWVLEGSVITADSMRSRGYGTARRTSFQIYRMTARDWVLLAVELFLAAAVIIAGGTGAEFVPRIRIAGIGWGFGAYCVYLLIPIALHIKEAFVWRISISRI